jgi:mannose-6-phosphate isomerase-like protein (cupin superfamily)
MRTSHREALTPFVTRDGSTIRELAGPAWSTVERQSLAEATVDPGAETAEHFHPHTEEIYYFVAGAGRMRLGEQEGVIAAGDCVVVPPGVPHKLWNTGGEALVLLCCCVPAYSDDDTVMTGR